MKAIKITENIYWVGAVDWDLRNFHGYLTQRGSTYNSYLIIDEKITLIDNVKSYMYDEMIERISSVTDPSNIEIVIQNHVEMDHSGTLPKLMELIPDAEIYTSPNGEKGLKAHYRKDWNFHAVTSNEVLKLGKYSINFQLTPMVHWPDNMISYCPEAKLLFSNDAFGQHIASSERFDDEYDIGVVMTEAKKYYANIVLPFGMQVMKALDVAANLEIDVIAPSHGVIWRKNIPEIIRAYENWATHQTDEKAVIIYDTMWGSTEKIASAIKDAFDEKGIKTVVFNVRFNHISDIMTELINAKYICVGSPTLNNNMLPTVASFLTYLKGLAPKNRKALAFGSYGWGGQSVGLVEEDLKKCKFDIMDKVRLQYIPAHEDLLKVKKQITENI
ncbi:MAG: MBL fold metallo-hydrolase [Candidatus Cloacimonadota bacterium]|nr:MAG: MBL fold metallo-hydrolase [Candidatus Cloacimonadota bacterium]